MLVSDSYHKTWPTNKYGQAANQLLCQLVYAQRLTMHFEL